MGDFEIGAISIQLPASWAIQLSIRRHYTVLTQAGQQMWTIIKKTEIRTSQIISVFIINCERLG